MALIKIQGSTINTHNKDVSQILDEAFKNANLNINDIVLLEEKLIIAYTDYKKIKPIL